MPSQVIEPLLQLVAASRTHGSGASSVTALVDVSLTVERGEFVAIMGPSGSGKSSLLHLAGGLDKPTSGEVLLAGTALSQLSASALAKLRRRQVGYVFQDFNLIPGLSAAENVALPLELDGASWRSARQQALQMLDECGVAELADRRPQDMSGGQAQRVAIARALAGPRQLLLADEPTGALDSETGRTVLDLLRARVDTGAAVVMVTHEARFAAWADRTVYLRDGRITGSTGPSAPETLLAGLEGRE